MADWSTDIASTDDDVDEHLGDTFQFSADGIAPFTPLNGFVNPEEADITAAALDPMTDKPRIKISRRKLAVPSQANRFIVPQFDAPAGTKWRPEQWGRVTRGRYWIIELQKAVT